MTTTTMLRAPEAPPTPPPARHDDEPLSGNELRSLLVRLHLNDAWSTAPEAEALLRACMTKYAGLARRYGQTPHDAAVAAFEAFRAPGMIEAADPWAVITIAVQRSLQAEDRATGLLCSASAARKLMHTDDHDVIRFGERDDEPWTDLPAVERTAADSLNAEPHGGDTPASDDAEHVAAWQVPAQIERVVGLMEYLGWPRSVAVLAVEYVCRRLILAGSAARAFEYLRKDRTPLGLLDLDRRSWTRLCATLLGAPDSERRFRVLGRGILQQVLVGVPLAEILTDDDAVAAIWETRPTGRTRPTAGARCA